MKFFEKIGSQVKKLGELEHFQVYTVVKVLYL
jgi:hypothetical protein